MKRKTGLMLILLLLACTAGFNLYRMSGTLPPEMVRLHVVANSNMFYDQELKYKVKDRIVTDTAAHFGQATSAAEAMEITDLETVRIANAAREEIRRQGFDYPVRIERGNFYFPLKSYSALKEGRVSQLTLPCGRYEAMRVVIGEGRGANWWCVLYPPLCFVDARQTLPPVMAPTAGSLEKKFNDAGDSPAQPRIEYRLQVAEIWRKLAQ